ncbi:MAG: hypothetical protein LQ341_001073 [Variospora aurantia]|nr:MAG: hypothetical protein LQ341_001073 [Variospora aurantia]
MSKSAKCSPSAIKRYKAACDRCHSSKVKCPGGGPPCERCADGSYPCTYSLTARIGKPPGSRNKKTLERLHHAGQAQRERDSGTASVEHALARSPSQASQTSMTQSTLPVVEHSYCSGSSRSSPPLAHDLFDIDDSFNESSDALGLWSSDMGDLDLGDLGKDDFGLSSVGTCEDDWNVEPQSSVFRKPITDATELHTLDRVAARLEEIPESQAVTDQRERSPTLSLCRCSRKYSQIVSQLQTIEERQRPVKLDTLLTCANIVLATVDSLAQCSQCLLDTRVSMQLVIIFQTLLTWIEIHCHSINNTFADVPMVLGSHELTRDEYNLVTSSLINRLLKRTSALLSTMTTRAEQIARSRQEKDSQDQGGTDLRAFQQLNYSLLSSCRSLSKGLSSPKLFPDPSEQSRRRRDFEGF